VAIEHPVICAVDRGLVKGMLAAMQVLFVLGLSAVAIAPLMK